MFSAVAQHLVTTLSNNPQIYYELLHAASGALVNDLDHNFLEGSAAFEDNDIFVIRKDQTCLINIIDFDSRRE